MPILILKTEEMTCLRNNIKKLIKTRIFDYKHDEFSVYTSLAILQKTIFFSPNML